MILTLRKEFNEHIRSRVFPANLFFKLYFFYNFPFHIKKTICILENFVLCGGEFIALNAYHLNSPFQI